MDNLPEIASPVVTVGSFDGVHVGHRVIIGRLNDLADQVNGSSVLITFHPHPRIVLYPGGAGKDLKLINSQQEKIMLLEEAGLEHLVIMEFTRDFARTTSEDFIADYLHGRLNAHTIVVGFNHYFGHNKEGSFESLYKARKKYGFRVEEIPEQEIQNETVSSTKIRKALKEGNIQRANAYLEHHYLIKTAWSKQLEKKQAHNCPGWLIQVEDPLKLLPSAGGYAASFQQDGMIRKGLLTISDRQIFLFPLEAGSARSGLESILRLHKRVSQEGDADLGRQLEAVGELIY